MKIEVRKLNRNEQYACWAKDIKRVFAQNPDDITVRFGHLSKIHQFDSTDHSHPKISGQIIASAFFNTRDMNGIGMMASSQRKAYIEFYVIRDDSYTNEKRGEFVERILPEISKWYAQVKQQPETTLSGIETLLVEWNRGNFQVHQYRFH